MLVGGMMMINWIKGLWFEFVILWETLIDTTDSYHDMSDEIEKATKQLDDMYDKVDDEDCK